VSYDGAGEPLGRSQVIAYLLRLASSCDITLISFEKGDARHTHTAKVLAGAGISWKRLSYHKHPLVLSTLWDILVGAAAVRAASRDTNPDVVHARSVVPGVMALLSRWPTRRKWSFLFDIRAFWADERVAAGSWSHRGSLHRLAKRCELWCFQQADAVVTLTSASVPQIRVWCRERELPMAVIPTCADVESFGDGDRRAEGGHVVWCGSIGTFYRFDLAVRFAAALDRPFTVLTRQVELARTQLAGREADVREVAPEDVPTELRPGDIGLCFYVDSPANLARAPTRFAEYLAAGMVVAVTPGIGDLDAVVRDLGVGVRIDDESEAGLARAASRIGALAADPDVQARARRVARECYSVEEGARAYLGVYEDLCSRGSTLPADRPSTPAAGAAPTKVAP
jgi:glycosyltransferase involved in cell wall biosynthesis